MNLFKPKARLSDVCQNFYDSQIFYPNVAGVDMIGGYCESVLKTVSEADPSFQLVDIDDFIKQFIAIYFEIFSLAWLHEVGEKAIVSQSMFTKGYLVERNRSDIWDTMEQYNSAIAKSSSYNISQSVAAVTDKKRLDMFGHWTAQGFEAKCVARAINRMFTEKPWKEQLTPGFVMLALCKYLNQEPNDEAQFRLVAVIQGLYNGARQSLSKVKIAD